jgi:hypothetical protein
LAWPRLSRSRKSCATPRIAGAGYGFKRVRSGKADFSKLAAGNVAVHIFGSGLAIVAPSGAPEAGITGSGAVHLTTRPRTITRSITGSGQVVEDY